MTSSDSSISFYDLVQAAASMSAVVYSRFIPRQASSLVRWINNKHAKSALSESLDQPAASAAIWERPCSPPPVAELSSSNTALAMNSTQNAQDIAAMLYPWLQSISIFRAWPAQGGDDTFGDFPAHLRTLLSHALPNISVKALTYPKFETRGDLAGCVGRFREWLQNKVIDLEVAASTPSPTVDPSVHTVLIGHSMGGIVAAETLLAIMSDAPIPAQPPTPKPSTAAHTEFVPHTPSPPPTPEPSSFMFPHISGILAFDTPYLGISPGVIAHGAETHYKTATSAWSAVTEMASLFSAGAKSPTSPKSPQPGQQEKLLTQGADAMTASMSASSSGDAAATPTWQRWGKYAMFAGAAGAVAAGGAAAYLKRDSISEGWSWMGSHLEFVGCLAKGEELKTRLEKVIALNQERGLGFANLVTLLGQAAAPEKRNGAAVAGTTGSVEVGAVDGTSRPERTFCTLPKNEANKRYFEKNRNDRARDETEAHMEMFDRKRNTGYFVMAERAKDLISGWIEEEGSFYTNSDPLSGGTTDDMASATAMYGNEGEEEKALKMEDMEEERLGDVDMNDKAKKSSEFSDMEDVDLGHGPEADAWVAGDEPVMVEK